MVKPHFPFTIYRNFTCSEGTYTTVVTANNIRDIIYLELKGSPAILRRVHRFLEGVRPHSTRYVPDISRKHFILDFPISTIPQLQEDSLEGILQTWLIAIDEWVQEPNRSLKY